MFYCDKKYNTVALVIKFIFKFFIRNAGGKRRLWRTPNPPGSALSKKNNFSIFLSVSMKTEDNVIGLRTTRVQRSRVRKRHVKVNK